jgi:CheY-like chemotaxis protein
LIVDDNQDAADTLAVLAGLRGHQARAVYDGETALRVAREFAPDCLFLDIGMPRMDGYTLARELRSVPELETVTLIALTAYSSDNHLNRAGEAGFDYFLTKPADPGDLERVFRMLAQALKLAKTTESLARKNAELARETKDLLNEVKAELKYVKKELREVKDELRDRQGGGG